MSMPILATKLYIPPPRSQVVLRPRLFERLNEGLRRRLTLISAPAGFGKTTLVSEWVAGCKRSEPKGRVAWLSLDEGDSDPTRFLTYLIAALQTITPSIGKGVLGALQSPQPPSAESILTALLNEIAAIPDHFILVLDDYHVIDAKPIDQALTFLIEHLPPQMHLVITTREDPHLSLAQLRVRDQLVELRAADLRFTPSEVADFLNPVMGLKLSADDIAVLENRTEGWIAGLQLAALSMHGHHNVTRFIQSFTGSHRFVMDYLVEQVLHQQSESVQQFLLRTSILDRMCGPLCDAVLGSPSASGQETLETPGQETLERLERANLFIVPLDNERRWYRYHHLFGELLRKRLHQSLASSTENAESKLNELHSRASQWYEDHGSEIEAFHHAAAAHDIERAERLIEGKGMPLHFRGGVAPVLNWLESLPAEVLDARPSLWTAYASTLLVTGQTTRVEQKLQAAEAALQGAEPDAQARDLIGRIAATRATMAVNQNHIEAIITQSRRALEYLHPNNLAFRTSTAFKLGFAYQFQGDRGAAIQAYTQVISTGETSGNIIFTIAATIGLGTLQEAENQLYLAVDSYRRALQLFGDQPLPVAGVAHLGLARIFYEWNDLDAAQQHGQESLQLARQIENNDRFVASEVFLARLKLAQGDVAGAAAMLAETEQTMRQQNLMHQMPEIAGVQMLVLLRQGDLAAAAHLAETYPLPLRQARVFIAQGDPSAALAVLESYRQQMEAKNWQDELLKVTVLQAVAHYAREERDKAAQRLGEALSMAEPGGFIRLFVDEGEPMRPLMTDCRLPILKSLPHLNGYLEKLLAVFPPRTIENPQSLRDAAQSQRDAAPSAIQNPVEPLSQRELEILKLIAQGLSNREISERLFLALDTVKGHNRRIFDKLQVQRRTEAIARARELGLL